MKARTKHGAAQAQTLYEQAALWAMRDRDGPMEARSTAARETWLTAKPEHLDAYAEATRALSVVAANMADPAIMALRRKALKARPTPPPLMGRVAAGAAVCAAIGVIGFGLHMSAPRNRASNADFQAQVAATGHIYRTGVGERRAIALPDGSMAILDTASVVRVRYTNDERAVDLVQGQALFKVAKRQPAPFQVYAGDQRITATGTVFDVRLEPGRVRVSLLEGHVRVASVNASDVGEPAREVALEPGQALEERGSIVHISAIDPVRTKSWVDGVLDFEDEPLSSAVLEVNRYSANKIVLEGAEIRNLRISGLFTAGDSERFAQTLADLFSLQITHDADKKIILVLK